MIGLKFTRILVHIMYIICYNQQTFFKIITFIVNNFDRFWMGASIGGRDEDFGGEAGEIGQDKQADGGLPVKGLQNAGQCLRDVWCRFFP